VRAGQIIFTPITTPAYPDRTEAQRYIRDDCGIYGYDYVFLEDATWNALCEIARERGCTVDELCSDIELNFAPGDPFEQAARHYVLRYIAEIPDNIELPANFRVLTELIGAHRHAQ
jgi:predicted DNA-binding ribbon-helix-helix protein